MTDRLEAAARALCVLGGGHTTEGTYPNCDHVAQHEDGARVALAAADAVDPVLDLLHWGWTIICNAGEGDWSRESDDWQKAAARFGDEYHAATHDRLPLEDAVALEPPVT